MSSLFKFKCPFYNKGCPQKFRSQQGRTNHVRSQHHNHNIITNSQAPPSIAFNPLRSEVHEDEAQHLPLDQEPSENVTDDHAPNQPPLPQKNYHPHLTAHPCDSDGNYLPPGTPPKSRSTLNNDDWAPFDDGTQFRLGEFLYREAEMSGTNIDTLMDLWALSMGKHDDYGPFSSHEHMYSVIDSIPHGDAPWKSFKASYADEIGPDAPSWQLVDYEVWYRDPGVVVKNLLDNPDFDRQFDYAPFVELDKKGERRWNEFMSGNFSWRHATDIYEADNTTEGAMYCPIILGADKTTVSVATGHVEYHPLYLSIGNVHNTVRRAHRNAVVPIGFLAIPKSDRKYDNSATFRKFKRQLYHASISAILQPLHNAMTKPVVRRCPDGHFRRVIYDLGAFIADYPEQVYLAGTVQGWCPKCTALPDDLDGLRGRRTQALTEELLATFDSKTLWDEYGIDDDIRPFTYEFPRADIHEILTPDLLHQLIKGTFKDHLVTWVCDYLALEHGEARADVILDDIDRRIAATPPFSNLRRFPHGRRFKQWTGDDSKALMKVYVSAIQGYVPDMMVEALSSFIDVCYLVRRSDITESTLKLFDAALTKFYTCREIFRTSGVRPTGFSLPRQHSLSHYRHMILEFGAPNGICSSIMESRHITAVKKPWRKSNRYEALGQMLLANQRLDKLAAARVDFVNRGMLPATTIGRIPPATAGEERESDDDESGNLDVNTIQMVEGNVVLARSRVRNYPRYLDDLAIKIDQPTLPELTRRFLFDQLNMDPDVSSDDVDLDECPAISSKIDVFHSAVATFFAPSDECGLRGMRRERIRSCPSWRKKGPRRDCAFVVEDEEKLGMRGMAVVRVHLFFSFNHEGKFYPCSLVEWFLRSGRSKDAITGMWKVRPDIRRNGRFLSVLHLDTFLRAAHLLPIFSTDPLPVNFDHSYSLDAFAAFYVNHFADHHAHEFVF